MFLYLRMFLTMGVSLYTSRVILEALGVEDFGIYSVIGGVVSLFAFLNSAMSSATQRFLAVNIAKDKGFELRRVFNAALLVHIGIALVVLLIAETIGLWFVNYRVVLPAGSLYEANVVYQLSILATLIGITQVPFNALIVARERMNIFAIISVLETVLRLVIVLLLVNAPFSKLITFASLILVLSVVISSIYKYYCYKNFDESKFLFVRDSKMYKGLVSYSGWNLIGNFAAVCKGQGVNMMLNVFFGTILNAAYGIMMQVQTAVQAFVMNFQTAVNPRIYKLYAQKDLPTMHNLVFSSSKFSFFLLLIIVFPIIYNVEFILNFWLKTPPDFSVSFVLFSLINLLIESLSGPLITSALATGRIRNYQIVVGSILLLNLPMSFIGLKIFNNPIIFLYVSIFLSLISLCFRVFFLKDMISLKVGAFLKKVILPAIFVTLATLIWSYVFFNFFGRATSFFDLIWMTALNCVWIVVVIIIFGIKKDERMVLMNGVKKIVGR